MSNILFNIYFDNYLLNYLIFLGIAIAGVILGKILYWVIQKIVKKATAKSKTKFDDILVHTLEKPAVIFIILIAINIGFNLLQFPNYPKIPIYFGHLMYMLLVLTIAWVLSKFCRALIETYVTPLASKTETDLDDHLIPILRKLISISIYVIAFIMILNHFGQEIGPLLAGLGIGGLAFALAAKDLLSNLFGSVTIIFDKPFKVGQRIKINDKDGTVEEINLRTTKIKTLEGRMLYVPNAKFTDNIVENVSQEWARKVKMTIGLTYDTDSKKMNKAKEILRNILTQQKGVDSDKINIAFTEFGDFSKNLLVIYWITAEEILEVKDEVNMMIMEEFDKAKIDMAFPTQTIEVKKIK